MPESVCDYPHLTSPTTNDKQQPTMTLFPLRIDVASSTAGVRIVDTILFDSTCWLIPLLLSSSRDAVEKNVQELAHSIVADAEVSGMGRTIRHFTGRADLYTKALHDQVADQLRPQLYQVLEDMQRLSEQPNNKTTTIHLSLNTHGVLIQDSFEWDTSIRLSPIVFAEQMVWEMNLPEEATVAIATAILEQLHGLDMSMSLEGSKQNVIKELDPKEHLNHLSYIVGLHR